MKSLIPMIFSSLFFIIATIFIIILDFDTEIVECLKDGFSALFFLGLSIHLQANDPIFWSY
jgi:hypothetical protein